MDACMNMGQQVTEYQQAANMQWNMQRNKKVSIRHKNISKFCLITRPLCHKMTRWKHRWMTHMIEIQGKNQTST